MALPSPMILLSALIVCLASERASAAVPLVDDPNGIAAADSNWAAGIEHRLEALESTSGVRVVIQFHAKSPTEQEDRVDGAYMKGIATSLGIAQKGVLMVYFADDPDWRVWIGDDLTPQFAGKSGNVAELTASGAIHKAKEAYLTGSVAEADAAFGAATGPKPASRRIAMEADTLLKNLCAKLGIR